MRALWAGRPHVWQIYEQDDGVHADKLDAFMQRWMGNWPSDLTRNVQAAWRAWNLLNSDNAPLSQLLKLANTSTSWLNASQESARNLATQADLTSQLLEFALEFVTHPG